ncbi:helix-turn-helix transcriptional regulator [Frankia sp. Cr2]|uniref:helix-turn-helix domain-containing protein n=1 Tax=Frankia sp. Cr2 TaxID=3073932 RepID=UPI002AD42791|nr:helix-turn-helix transcriptional regulator [Frankia sp. Cr2]
MVLLRRMLGEALRRRRQDQRRTLREVSSAARVSLGYLSEIERGQKEASSELLAAICAALGVRLADLLREVSDDLELAEFAAGGSARVGGPMAGMPPMAAMQARGGGTATAVVERAA